MLLTGVFIWTGRCYREPESVFGSVKSGLFDYSIIRCAIRRGRLYFFSGEKSECLKGGAETSSWKYFQIDFGVIPSRRPRTLARAFPSHGLWCFIVSIENADNCSTNDFRTIFFTRCHSTIFSPSWSSQIFDFRWSEFVSTSCQSMRKIVPWIGFRISEELRYHFMLSKNFSRFFPSAFSAGHKLQTLVL